MAQIEMATQTPAGTLTLVEAEQFLSEVIDAEGTVAPEQEEEFKQLIGLALMTAEGKRDAVASFIQNAEMRAEFCRKEVRRIEARARTFENVAQRVRDYVAQFIMSMPKVLERGTLKPPKLQGGTLMMSVRQNPARTVIDDEAISETYRKVTLTLTYYQWRALISRMDDEFVDQLVKFSEWSTDKDAIKAAGAVKIRGVSHVPGTVSLVIK